jgi:hypothetical protein
MRRLRMIAMAVAVPLALGAVLAPQAASAAPASPVKISFIFYNSPGPDNHSLASLRAEYVLVQNTTNHRVTITNWTITDKAHHTFKFGRTTLPANANVYVHTSRGRPTGSPVFQRFWGRTNYAWSNTGDTAVLKNAAGTVKSRCSYSDPHQRRLSHRC